MVEQAAHSVDEVIPAVPVRPWLLSLPFWLRYRVAYDHKLFSEVLTVWTKAVTNFYRKRAREQHNVDDGLCAAISGIQRFGNRRSSCQTSISTRCSSPLAQAHDGADERVPRKPSVL